MNTIIPAGTLTLDVRQLCSVINEHRPLQRTEIRAIESYTETTGRVVLRFLIFELHREGRKPIWIRLDRGPSGSRLRRMLGSPLAHDIVGHILRCARTSSDQHQPTGIAERGQNVSARIWEVRGPSDVRDCADTGGVQFNPGHRIAGADWLHSLAGESNQHQLI